MDDDELPPPTVLIEQIGPFWLVSETTHTPDSIAFRAMIVEADDAATEEPVTGDQ